MNKKTFRVQIENVEIFSAIMTHFEWKEIDRVATGGMMSQPELLITFQGSRRLDSQTYIEQKDKYINNYFTIDYPNGFSANSVEEFFKNKSEPQDFEVKRYCSYA